MAPIGRRTGHALYVNQRADQDVDIVGRPDLKAAPDNEPAHVQFGAGAQFFEQQAADQKAAEDEEQVYARPSDPHPESCERLEEARLVPSYRRVPTQHEQNSQPAQKVHVIGPDGRPVTAIYPMRQLPDGTWRIDGCFLQAPEEHQA